MVIKQIDVMQLKTVSPGWRPVLCRIHTDEGIFGDGEACVAFGKGSSAAYGMLRDMAGMIIGDDPMNTEAIWHKLYTKSTWGLNGGPIVFAAMSALDTALWDIKGKALNTPVYKLLGGECRNKIRAYASQLQHGWRPLDHKVVEFETTVDTDDLKRCAEVAMQEGFDAVKVDFLELQEGGQRMPAEKQDTVVGPEILALAEKRMAAVREVVGPEVSIIVEAHAHNSATGAVQIANALEKYGVFYYEEPNTPNPTTARYIAEHTNVPLASGERIYTRWQYAPYFADGSLRVIQPDIGTSGGFTETKKICDMAHCFDVSVQPHVCGTHLSTSVALQLEAVIPNFAIHEYNSNLRAMCQDGITKYAPAPVHGYFELPDEPGIGNEILPEAYEKAILLETITENAGITACRPNK